MLELTKQEYEKIIVSLDRIAFDPEKSELTAYRQQVVDCLFDVFGYSSLFWLINQETQLSDPIYTNIEYRAMAEYFETYHTQDVLAPVNIPVSLASAPIVKIGDIMSYEQFRKTEYSLGYFEKFGYVDEMGIYMYDKSELIGVIGLVRKREEGLFSDKDRKRLHFLVKTIEGTYKAARILNKQVAEPILLQELTTREREIVKLVQKGLLNKEIGHVLSISVNTVKKHLQNIFQKLGVENRTELGYYLSRTGRRSN